MPAVTDGVREQVDAYLEAHQQKSVLRFITCGSVDDGKSTLVGRLLYESQLLFEDQVAALEAESRRNGGHGDELDYALLLDGLQAEREQGITIDVAYRYFSTDRRAFVMADTPGHEQYTRNMVTGASTADCAVVVIDARNGVLHQTRRHFALVSLLGLRHVAVAVTKMDLVGYVEEPFRKIESDIRALGEGLGVPDVLCIPVSGLRGDNVVASSARMPWYGGTTLMQYLETIEIEDEHVSASPLRFFVQWISRDGAGARGLCGTVVGGSVALGDPVVVLPSGRESLIARIATYDGDLDLAVTGQSVTLMLEDEIDVSRGDLISAKAEPAGVADQFEATVVWR